MTNKYSPIGTQVPTKQYTVAARLDKAWRFLRKVAFIKSTSRPMSGVRNGGV